MLRFSLIIALVTIGLDQATKLLAVNELWNPYQVLRVFEFLNLVPVENRGISFGLFQSSGEIGRWVISIFSILVVICIFFWLRRDKRKFPSFCFGMIVGGALGNVIDRLRQGWVIDFIDFYVQDWHWPAFNLADTFIVLGACLLLIHNLIRPQKRS
tara:strand:- start:7710 stop:8177 length:468 start_codon:yes stop_codon:yes gene_type:complete